MADFQPVVSFDQIAKGAHFDSGDKPLFHLPIEAKKAQNDLPAVVGEAHEQLPPAPRSNRSRFDNLALDLPRGAGATFGHRRYAGAVFVPQRRRKREIDRASDSARSQSGAGRVGQGAPKQIAVGGRFRVGRRERFVHRAVRYFRLCRLCRFRSRGRARSGRGSTNPAECRTLWDSGFRPNPKRRSCRRR